ncbi:flagellin [Cohaesibacter haloalkalitolerans]|uniref:flagellin N-terminal helical domain-containing protein n=1 Tax=Cohaesibacter haloalkalitolerans TaxID=1162980 RepID=UPI000E64F1D4|nr:flagellin [Cohaesibacter haloalkalitolerans]
MPIISTNIAASVAVRYLNKNSDRLSDSIAKLSSGSRISKASDDPAGLAIATGISSDLASLEQASVNASNSLALLQTADGGAASISEILERMKSLASQAASGTIGDDERSNIQTEFAALLEEIDSISTGTRYNGVSLLDGSSDYSDDTVETAAVYESGVAGGYSATASAEAVTASFKVNGTTVTLASLSDGTNTSAMSADDLAAAINVSLQEQGQYTVSASVDASGAIVMAGVETGEHAELEITDVTGDAGLLASVGLTAGTDVREQGSSIVALTTGANVVVGSEGGDTINLSIQSLTAEALGLSGLDLSTRSGASKAFSLLDVAIGSVADMRAEVGATMSRFEFRARQIDTSIESLEAAESAIMDVDIAREMARMSSDTVRVKAAAAAVAQANLVPQYLLKLLQ